MKRLKNALYVSLGVATLALSVNGSVIAQRHGYGHSIDSRMYFDYGDPLTMSVIQSPDGRSADVRVATASAAFSYQRTRDNKHGAYYAIRDVTVEVIDQSSGDNVLTKNQIDTIYVKTFEQSTSKDDWHAMSQHLDLPQFEAGKKYSVKVEVRDDIDRLTMRPMIAQLRTPSFTNTTDSNGIAVGDLLLIDSLRGRTAFTSARDHSYMFSKDVIGAVAFKLADTLTSTPIIDVRVRQVSNRIDPADTGARGDVVASDLHKGENFELQGQGDNLRYALVPTNEKGIWTAIFTVPGKQFQQGKYEFSVRVRLGAEERTLANEVNIEWQNMPISLADAQAAIEPLQHIATQGEYSSINSGSKQDMIRNLYAYWRNQDPTPGTAFNERMAAFYERVDYADFNYATTPLLDGVMTDRGKIYLLYGAPSKIDRSFLPGESPVETWTYFNNVKRVFRFEERSHDAYKLIDIQNLATN